MGREMKKSGIEWIGDIPETWNVYRHKHVMHKEKNLCEHYNGEDIISLTMNGVVIRNLDAGGKMPATFDGYQYVDPEDLLLCLFDIDVTPRCVGLVKNYGITSPAYSRFKVHQGYHSAYYDYLLRTIDDKKVLVHLAKNLRSTFTESDFGALPTVVPPLEEQKKIALFLDSECSRIDSVIEKTQASIEEYKKLKQAIITEAVTKGIRPKRKMKESGIEWVKEIPSEWTLSKVKVDYSFGKGLPITKDNLVEDGVPVISYGQIHAKANTGVGINKDLIRYVSDYYMDNNPGSLVRAGDFIFADTSEDVDGCGNCVYIDIEDNLFAGYHTIILKSRKAVNNKYYAYLFKSDSWRKQIRTKVSGVKVFSVSKKMLSNASLLVPSYDEQKEIVRYLDNKCDSIDRIVSAKENLITELESYRKSLIFEYVTGKKEVV